jgi:hypothetical protein
MRSALTFCLFFWAGSVLHGQIIAHFTEEQQTVFGLADKYVRQYGSTLPEFMATQSTCHYVDKKGIGTKWKQTRCVEEEVLFHGGRESYRLIGVNSKTVRPKDIQFGSTTVIEYEALIACIFEQNGAMKSRPEITWERSETVGDRKVYVFGYRIPEDRSPMRILSGSGRNGFHGLISIDGKTGEVLKIDNYWEPASRNPTFQTNRLILEYNLVSVGDRQYMLPVKMWTYIKTDKSLFRRETVVTQYRKFTVETKVTMEAPANP